VLAFGLELLISNKVREIRDEADHIRQRIGVLAQHDEIKLTDKNLIPSDPKRIGRR